MKVNIDEFMPKVNKIFSNISLNHAIDELLNGSGQFLILVTEEQKKIIYIRHQKKIIDRLSRRIQKLKNEIRILKQNKSGNIIISSDGMRLFIGDEEVASILDNKGILNLESNAVNQKVNFQGKIYTIRKIVLNQQIGCLDELQIICHNLISDKK